MSKALWPTGERRPESQTRFAHEELEGRIVRLELPPGEVVSEKMLAASLSIGRTPVREALRELAREGLVVILPQRGIIIAEIEVAKHLRMIELRSALLRFVVTEATRRASAEQRYAFRDLAKRLESADGRDRLAALAIAQHFVEQLLAAARNEFAAAAFQLTNGLNRRFTYASIETPEAWGELLGLCGAIAAAVGDNDADRAYDALGRLQTWKTALAKKALERG